MTALNGQGRGEPVTQVIISIFANGEIDVKGPLHDKLHMLGMLSFAERIVQDYKPGPIIPVNGADIKRINKS